jgi:hypothetical protein
VNVHHEGPLIARETAPLAGNSELAEALMLVRASTLKLIRLQLAMERHDRQVALEAVDELVALDRKLQDYLDGVAANDEQLIFRRCVEADRSALNREKLTLGAGVLRAPDTPAQDLSTRAERDDWLGPREIVLEEEPRRRPWRPALISLAASGLAAAAYLLGGRDQAWLAGITGALR